MSDNFEGELLIIAKALNGVPDGTELDSVPDVVRKTVIDSGGSHGAAELARSIILSILKATSTLRGRHE